MKHHLVIIKHSLPGQPGVYRTEKSITAPGSSPEVSAKRALKEYRKENTHGKKNLSYYITIKPLTEKY